MRIKLRKTTTFSALFVGVALFVTLGISTIATLSRPVQAASHDGRLVTVHDRGTETTFLTKKGTLREALNDASIEIDQHDAVEPSLDERLVASDYQVNIYRARPVTVVDGQTRLKVITPYQTTDRIAADAGVKLYAEDATKFILSDSILDGAGLEMHVDRATLVTLDLYGKTIEMRTQATTIAEMLKEKNITLGANGKVSPSSDTAIEVGLSIRVWREGKQTITVEEAVAFETEKIKDADRPTSYKEVQTPGVEGARSVTYEVVIENGIEVARTEIASVTTREPVKQVEVVGSKPNSLPYTGGGTKSEWLAASSIPQESWGYADFMVQKESGWNPNAVNKSSGACGLAQALPCSKLGPNWSNPVTALNWMNSYVNGRYYDGSPYTKGLCSGITDNWQCAYTFWQANKWY